MVKTPWTVSRRLNDFAEMAELFGEWNGEFHQLSRGQFKGVAHIVAGNVVRYFRAETGQAILTRGMGEGGYVSFIPVNARNEGCVWQGRQLSPGQLVVKGPDVDYEHRSTRGAQAQCLLIPEHALREAMRDLAGDDAGDTPTSWNALRPTPATLRRFERRLDQVLCVAVRDPRGLDRPEGRLLESECIRVLTEMLLESWPVARVATNRGRRRFDIVRRAVDLMHDRMEEPLTAMQICRALGLSDRVLRRAFRETYGLGPMAYLRVMRMHAVRDALLAARGSEATVAEIAGRWGFCRLGAFAAEYRRHFGVRPSESLGVRGWPGVKAMTRSRVVRHEDDLEGATTADPAT